MQELTHIDLFTGIGGFSLSALWNNIRTEVQCENDEKCQNFLKKTWGLPIVSDVREFDGTKWQGRFLLTSGTPCQPASRAGKQRGKADDRWLWGETLRIISEAKPRWILCENPPGIEDLFEYGVQLEVDGEGCAVGKVGKVVNRTGRGLFNEILEALESYGYEVAPPLHIPACAVNSPQIRQRVWIVAHSSETGIGDQGKQPCGQKRQPVDSGAEGLRFRNGETCGDGIAAANALNVAHAPGTRQDRAKRKEQHFQRPPLLSARSSNSLQSNVAYRDRERCEKQRRAEPVHEGTRGPEFECSSQSNMADRDSSRQKRAHRGISEDENSPRRTDLGDCDEGDLADANKGWKQREGRFKAEQGGDWEDGGILNGSDASRDVADARRTERMEGDNRPEQPKGSYPELTGSGLWDRFIWAPCADGKLRRTPANSQRMAHGLPVELLEELGTKGRQTPEECRIHRSILAALGNSIVWPVAAQIIRSIIEAQNGCE